MQNSSGKVFRGIPVGPDEDSLFVQFLDAHDFANETRRGFTQDVKKLARWFASANGEPFCVGRVTITDITSFRDYLRRELGQSVATVNRALVTIRRFFHWLVDQGHVSMNPAKQVKELKRQELAPKGLERTHVRRLLRECELRHDLRASAIFHFFLFCGARVSDVANLELPDLLLSERSGTAVLRHGNPRPHESKHDRSLHKEDGTGIGRGFGSAELLIGSCRFIFATSIYRYWGNQQLLRLATLHTPTAPSVRSLWVLAFRRYSAFATTFVVTR